MLNRQAKPSEGGQAPHTERMKIYLAELGEKADSSVQGGTRPVIVLQNNAGNRSSPTVIVAPITSKLEKPHLPTHVVLGQANLPKQSMVLLEQVYVSPFFLSTMKQSKADLQCPFHTLSVLFPNLSVLFDK